MFDKFNKLDNILRKEILNKKRLILLQVYNIVLFIIGLTLCLVWYDFKLFIIIFVMLFANNVDNNIKRLIKKENNS